MEENFLVQTEHVVTILVGLSVLVVTPLLVLVNKIGKNAADIENNKQMIKSLQDQQKAFRNEMAGHEEKCSRKYDQLFELMRKIDSKLSRLEGGFNQAPCLGDD